MSIAGFIQRKKEQFKNMQERARTRNISRMEEKTEKLRLERKVRESDAKIKAEYNKERALKKKAKMERFNEIKKGLKSLKKKKGKNNAFSFGSGQSPFTKQGGKGFL